jgi:hypothetical protein
MKLEQNRVVLAHAFVQMDLLDSDAIDVQMDFSAQNAILLTLAANQK